MGSKRHSKRLAAAAIAAVGLAGGAVAVYADTFTQAHTAATPATWPVIAPTACGDPCTITLHINAGTVAVQDVVAGGAVNVPFLGFGVNTSAVALAGSPASTIKVPVGTPINISVVDDTTVNPIDLSFPSLPLTDVVDNGGGSYTVTPSVIGTSVFQPGTNAQAPKQIAQGLVGVLIVTPDATTCTDPDLKCAYDGTIYDDEALVAMTDLDLEFANNPDDFDMGYFGQSIDPDFSGRQVYHVINGLSFPDTQVIDGRVGDNVLIRYVNAGVEDKSMGLLGLRQSLLARNTSKLADPQTLIAPLIGPGETADVAVSLTSAAANHFYSLIDSGRQMNNGTSTGFGGALTFVHVWAAATASVDTLAATADTSTQSVGNPLINREYATDFPTEQIGGLDAVLVVINAPLPEGTLQSFESWNQATAGSSPNASEGEIFRAYVLRPTATTNEYDVVYASADQTVPAPATAGVSEGFSVPASFAVQAGDVVAYFGSGVPVDITAAGSDTLVYPALAAPALNDTIVLGSTDYPVYPQARTYSFGAKVNVLTGTASFTATAHSSGPAHDITGYQTVVNNGAAPAEIDWSPVTAIGPGTSVPISTTVTAAPGQTIWVRVQEDGSVMSAAASIVLA